MRTVATIQARMNSSRLPGKVLKRVMGKPLLWWQISRLKESLLLDDIVVATTNNPADNEIVEFCANQKINCYRGPEDDVLSRISMLLEEYCVDIHVETFGDSPLVDAELLDRMIGYFVKKSEEIDFLTNAYDCGFPAGVDLNIYRKETLLSVNEKVKPLSKNREHVGYNILKSGKFRVAKIKAPKHLYAPDLFIEIDTAEDFLVVSKIIQHFSRKNTYTFQRR